MLAWTLSLSVLIARSFKRQDSFRTVWVLMDGFRLGLSWSRKNRETPAALLFLYSSPLCLLLVHTENLELSLSGVENFEPCGQTVDDPSVQASSV